MTRFVSDVLREPFGKVPPIAHLAAVDMEGPILAAEIIAFLLEHETIPLALMSSSSCCAAISTVVAVLCRQRVIWMRQ